jgi:hypothetical protein
LELEYPLKGAKCISHSLYNQAPKKAVLYEKQYSRGQDVKDGAFECAAA